MKKHKRFILIVFVIAVISVVMFLVGCDFGGLQTKEHIINTLTIHTDNNYYYIDVDGERYCYFK